MICHPRQAAGGLPTERMQLRPQGFWIDDRQMRRGGKP